MQRFCEKLPSDRRLAMRHNLETPMRLRLRGEELGARKLKSENLSQRGVFFTTDLPPDKGASVDVLLEMPQEVTECRQRGGFARGTSCGLCRANRLRESQDLLCNSIFTKCREMTGQAGRWE
jgi:hypothetical protein